MTQPVYTIVGGTLETLQKEAPYNSITVFLGLYPPPKKINKNKVLKRHFYTRVHSNGFHSSQEAEATHVFIDG